MLEQLSMMAVRMTASASPVYTAVVNMSAKLSVLAVHTPAPTGKAGATPAPAPVPTVPASSAIDWGDTSDFGGMFQGKPFYWMATEAWDFIVNHAFKLLCKNPAKGQYRDIWATLTNLYDTLDILAASLLALFFLYGFLRDSVDIRQDLTFETSIKLFIRLIVASNIMEMGCRALKKVLTWGKLLTEAICGSVNTATMMGEHWNGDDLYGMVHKSVSIAFPETILGLIFLLFTLVCSIVIFITVMNRLLRIWIITPFFGLAVSTIAGGGQLAQTGYAYIKAYLGYIGSALLIAVAIRIGGASIGLIDYSVGTDEFSGWLMLCLMMVKMTALTSAVKMVDATVQKAFNL